MRRHSFVVTVAAGALALGACKKDEPIRGNPPPPEPPPISTNPPPVEIGGPALPTWDEVASGHPEGATNPPIPHLVVKPDGTCHKLWVSPMKRVEPGRMGDYVDPDCEGEACGTPIECPPERAEAALAAWRKSQEAPSE